MPEHDRIPRRRFLATAAACATAFPRVFAQTAGPKPPARASVVEAADPAWQQGGMVSAAVVRRMLGQAMRALTGKASAADAWRQVVSPTERVGVKFNKVSANFSGASQALGDAILDGLMAAGVKRENIIVAEAVGASFPGTRQFDPTYGPVVDTGCGKTRLTRFITHQVDAVIDVPDLKHHERVGVTGALKNVAFGNTIVEAPWRFHGGSQHEHIAALYALPPIAGKCRLHILNGLRGLFHGGPRPRRAEWQWNRNSLLVSTDPVALDTIALEVIQQQRRTAREGIGPVGFHTGECAPTYLAIGARMGLGVAERSRIDVRRLEA